MRVPLPAAMITMSSDAMPCSLSPATPVLKLRRIIRLALLSLAGLAISGCSMLRLAYDQAPNLVYFWIDGYVDVNGEQTPAAARRDRPLVCLAPAHATARLRRPAGARCSAT